MLNQEYGDTTNFKKGAYTVTAQIYNGNGGPPGQGFFLGTLNVNARITPAPVYPFVNCGQPSHAWFGPSTVGLNQNMFIAAVARPGTTVNFFFLPSLLSTILCLHETLQALRKSKVWL